MRGAWRGRPCGLAPRRRMETAPPRRQLRTSRPRARIVALILVQKVDYYIYSYISFIYEKPGGLVGGTCFGGRWDDDSAAQSPVTKIIHLFRCARDRSSE